MFEKILKQNIAKISEKIKFDDFILFNDIMNNSDLGEPYKIFIKASVNFWIYEDELLRKANKSFNFNNSDDINKQINKIYFENFKLTRSDFEILLAYSVKIRLNYLLRPYFTLNKFIFNEDETKNISDVKRKLNFFVDYSHLLSGLHKILEDKQKSKNIISKIEFTEKLETIDKNNLLTFTADEYELLFRAIFEFFNLTNIDFKSVNIPVEALIIFLQDKGLFRLATNLKSNAETLDKKDYNLQEFFTVVSEITSDEIKISSNDENKQQENSKQESDIIQENSLNNITIDSANELEDIRLKLNALFE